MNTLTRASLLSLSCLMLTACGSSSSSGSGSASVSGTAAKGIVKFATVKAYSLKNVTDWSSTSSLVQIGTDAETDETGHYSLQLGSSNNDPVLLELTSNTNTTLVCDLATCATGTGSVNFGQDYPAPAGFTLRAVYNIDASASAVSLAITPLTTIAAKNALNQMTYYTGSIHSDQAVEMGNDFVKNVFQLDHAPANTQPIDITTATGSDADRARQSVLNAAFLQYDSDLDATLNAFAGQTISQANLANLFTAWNTVYTAVTNNNSAFDTGLAAGMPNFSSCTADGSGNCNFKMNLNDYLSDTIKNNLQKAKSLVSNTRGLLMALQKASDGSTGGYLPMYQNAATTLQTQAQPMSQLLAYATTLLVSYREAVLAGVDAASNLHDWAQSQCTESPEDFGFETGDSTAYCAAFAQRFGASDTFSRTGTTWAINNFAYDYDAGDCAIATANSLSISLPDSVRAESVSLNQGKVTAIVNATIYGDSCTYSGDQQPKLVLANANLTLDVKEDFVEDDVAGHRPLFNSMEFATGTAQILAGSSQFTGSLSVKAVHSAYYDSLSPDNEMGGILPKSLALSGQFKTQDNDRDYQFDAGLTISFDNAGSFGFIDEGTPNQTLANYRYESTGNNGKQQVVISVKKQGDQAAFNYYYRIQEPDGGSSAAIYISRSDDSTWRRDVWLNSYSEVLSAGDESACTTQQGQWGTDAICRRYTDLTKTINAAEVTNQTDCQNYGFTWSGGVCSGGSVIVINPEFDLRQLFKPEHGPDGDYYGNAWVLFGQLDRVHTNDGDYAFYNDHDGGTASDLSNATNTDQALTAYMRSPNPDVDQANRFIKATITLTANAVNLSEDLPDLDQLKLSIKRTAYRDATIGLNLKWKDADQKAYTVNLNGMLKNDALISASADDGTSTSFSLNYAPSDDIRGTITRDGTTYGTVKNESGTALIQWLDGALDSLF